MFPFTISLFDVTRRIPILTVLIPASCLCLCGYRLRPQPLPWRDIPDPAIDAERRIIIGQEDCGPVWLYNGILKGWHPDQSMELLDRIKLRHWRRGLWPHWYFAQMRNLPISY